MQSDLLSCPICYNDLDQGEHLPRVIPNCGHTVCSTCLRVLLNSQQGAKCPLDKKAFAVHQAHVETFPINFMVTQLLDGREDKEVCKDHNEEMRFICLTDKCKICDDCICFGKHEGHEIKSMKKVKMEADSKKKSLESLLERLDVYRKEIEGILEGRRIFLVKMVKERFEELKWLINNKEIQLTFEVNSYFEVEKEKVSKIIGADSVLRTDISKRVSDLTEIFKHEDLLRTDNFLGKIEDDILQFSSRISFDTIEKHTQELRKGLKKISDSLETGLKVQLDTYPKLEIPFISFSDNLLKAIINDNSITVNSETNRIVNIIKVKSLLGFEYKDKQLEIVADSRNPREVRLDIEKWRNITEVRLELRQYVLSEEDLRVLVYIWKKLENIARLRLKFNPMGISDEQVINVFKTILGGPTRFEEVDVDMEQCQITDQSVIFLVEKVLSKMKDLKSVDINLSSTPITSKSVEAITKSIVINTKRLESFKLFLTSTSITDEGIIRLFTSMPTIKQFSLGLSGTNISDRSIETFTKNTMPSLKALESFEIYLHTTKVTDLSLENLIPILSKVKRFSLDFGCTDITDRSLEQLAKTMTCANDKIEEFALSVGGTKVTDKSITKMFTPMPKVKNFLLGLFDTDVTDKTLDVFIQNTLMSMESLESFEMWLRDTEVTDESLEKMLINLKDIRKLSLDLRSTKLSDKSLEKFIKEKLPTMRLLEDFKMNIINTNVSERVKTQIEEFTKKVLK